MKTDGLLRPDSSGARNDKGRFFYGWVIVFGAGLCMFISSGASISFSVFFPALLKEFGWTKAGVALAFSLASVVTAAMGPATGLLVARFGPRRVVMTGAVLGAIPFLLLSRMTQLWQFYLIFALAMPAGRSLAAMIPNVTTIRRWFMRRAGLALGLGWLAAALGIVVLSPVSYWLINAFGWRGAYIAMAVIFAAGALLGGSLLKRDPESSGTHPDGIRPAEAELAARRDFSVRSQRWTMGEVVRTPTFWFWALAQWGTVTVTSSVLAHFIVWATEDVGVSTAVAVRTLSLTVLTGGTTMFTAGLLSDVIARGRWGRKPILMAGAVMIVVTSLTATAAGQQVPLLVVGIMIGFSYGLGLSLYGTFLGDLFGVVSLPTIYGYGSVITVLFGALGAWYFGLVADITGSYRLAFFILAGLGLLGVVSLALVRPPVKKAPEHAPIPSSG